MDDQDMKRSLRSLLTGMNLNPTMGMKKSQKTSLTRLKRNPKPITQRLRSIETDYALPAADKDTLWQARQLISDLWELHWDADSDLKEEARKLFERAGLEMNK